MAIGRIQPERPDDSNAYDDETLLSIIAERFARDADPITRRDAAWLVAFAEEWLPIRRTITNLQRLNATCSAEKENRAPEAGG